MGARLRFCLVPDGPYNRVDASKSRRTGIFRQLGTDFDGFDGYVGVTGAQLLLHRNSPKPYICGILEQDSGDLWLRNRHGALIVIIFHGGGQRWPLKQVLS
jgi:hypothetical protein